MSDVPARPARLSPRQRECLALVYERRTTKEIAAITGIAAGTVDGYIAEAVAILGARNRREAAELVHAQEKPPGGSGGQSAGVAAPAIDPAPMAFPERGVGLADLLPLRRTGAIGNDLSPFARLIAIVVLAGFLAIAFGMLAVGADVLGRLFGGAH